MNMQIAINAINWVIRAVKIEKGQSNPRVTDQLVVNLISQKMAERSEAKSAKRSIASK